MRCACRSHRSVTRHCRRPLCRPRFGGPHAAPPSNVLSCRPRARPFATAPRRCDCLVVPLAVAPPFLFLYTQSPEDPSDACLAGLRHGTVVPQQVQAAARVTRKERGFGEGHAGQLWSRWRGPPPWERVQGPGRGGLVSTFRKGVAQLLFGGGGVKPLLDCPDFRNALPLQSRITNRDIRRTKNDPQGVGGTQSRDAGRACGTTTFIVRCPLSIPSSFVSAISEHPCDSALRCIFC